MISIARKNLLSLFSSPNNSFLCNSNADFLLSIRLFSTWKVRRRRIATPCPEFYDVFVNKHHFSPEFASSLASLHSPKFTTPKRADSVLSFLKERSFTDAQLEKIVRYYPRILGLATKGLEFKFKLFRDLGLSSEEIAKMMVLNPVILQLSVKNKIIPSLSILKGLLGSNDEVARLLTKSGWFVTHDLKKTLMPNVEILKSCGAPMERVNRFLFIFPRCFLIKPDVMRKSVDKAIEFGVPPTWAAFIRAIEVLAHTSQGMWEAKMQFFCDWGFSNDEILLIFRKQPSVLSVSQQKLNSAMELLLGTGKYNISNIVTYPASLAYSIEKRLEPRLQILGLLESRNLIETWPCLGRVSSFTDAQFLGRFVSPYREEVGEAFDNMSYLNGKINETRSVC